MRSMDAGIAKRLVGTLSRLERHILMLYYAEELTVNEISLVLDISQPRIREILGALRARTQQALGIGALGIG